MKLARRIGMNRARAEVTKKDGVMMHKIRVMMTALIVDLEKNRDTGIKFNR